MEYRVDYHRKSTNTDSVIYVNFFSDLRSVLKIINDYDDLSLIDFSRTSDFIDSCDDD